MKKLRKFKHWTKKTYKKKRVILGMVVIKTFIIAECNHEFPVIVDFHYTPDVGCHKGEYDNYQGLQGICLAVKDWMDRKWLEMNASKTENIYVGSFCQLAKYENGNFVM